MLLDLLIILIMAFFVILGLMQGATKQVISLIRIAIAAIIATKLYVYLGKLIAYSVFLSQNLQHGYSSI